MENPSDNNCNVPRGRRTAISYLTNIAHASSPFIATFLLIHLSAPALANLGGSSLASQVMILGREYYQTSFGEKYLVLAPLLLHTSSGIAKRLLSSPPSKSPRPASSLLTLTGYGALLFLPVHFVTHRLNPTQTSAPIFAVGPAELDFEFVKLGLHNWPWRSWALYGGLLGCVFLHAAEGMNLMGSIWGMAAWGKSWKGTKSTRRYVAGISALPILTGLYFIFREPLTTFSSLARRFEAAFTQSLIYRL